MGCCDLVGVRCRWILKGCTVAGQIELPDHGDEDGNGGCIASVDATIRSLDLLPWPLNLEGKVQPSDLKNKEEGLLAGSVGMRRTLLPPVVAAVGHCLLLLTVAMAWNEEEERWGGR
ncbi:hypothetical protein ACLOJK_038842 [Asimina triloba]